MSDATQPSRVRSRILWTVKVVVTAGLGWFLFTRADWETIGVTLAGVPAGVILGSFALMLLSVTISAYKWQIVLKLHGLHFSFMKLQRYYFTAMFFSNFLPTSIGGDVYRVYKTSGDRRSISSPVIAVFMERLTGIIALLALGYLCSFLVYQSQGDAISKTLVTLGTAGIAVAVLAALLFVCLQGYRRLKRWQGKPKLLRILFEHGKDYIRQPTASGYVMLISFWFQVHNCLLFYVMLRYGVGVEISLPELFVVLTLVTLVGVLPISINGIGVVDTAFVVLLGVYGVGSDLALSVMLMCRMLLIPVSAIGAGFYLSERTDTTKQVESPGS